MGKIFVGTSGFFYPHWTGNFYPKELKKEDYLSYYARYFSTVEINSTFYHLPKAKTISNYLKKVPSDFVFSFKLSRFLTHIKKLQVPAASVQLFFQAIKPVVQTTPCQLILIQLPPSFSLNLHRLKEFFSLLPRQYLYALEFRHPSWFYQETYQFCQKENLAIVYSSNPGQWPQIDVETASFSYFRFHGERQLFSSSYQKSELEKYAAMIKRKLGKGIDVYAYFNNDALGFAVDNALTLKKLIEDK